MDVCWTTGPDIYRFYSIFIPVYGSCSSRPAARSPATIERFLERTAKIHPGLLICVYCLSYAPAMLDLNLLGPDGKRWKGSNAGLLFFFVLIVQLATCCNILWDSSWAST